MLRIWVFSHVKLCSLARGSQCFEGTQCLHLKWSSSPRRITNAGESAVIHRYNGNGWSMARMCGEPLRRGLGRSLGVMCGLENGVLLGISWRSWMPTSNQQVSQQVQIKQRWKYDYCQWNGWKWYNMGALQSDGTGHRCSENMSKTEGVGQHGHHKISTRKTWGSRCGADEVR